MKKILSFLVILAAGIALGQSSGSLMTSMKKLNGNVVASFSDGSNASIITGTTPNRAAAQDGTAAVPAYGFLNNLNLGLFRVSSNTLGFATSGTQMGAIDTNGTWSIGPITGGLNHNINGGLNFSGPNQVGGGFTVSNRNSSVANTGTLDITLSSCAGYAGVFSVTACLASNCSVRTSTTFGTTGRLANGTTTFTSLASGNGSGGGVSFSASNPSGNILRVTNNQGAALDIASSFTGACGG